MDNLTNGMKVVLTINAKTRRIHATSTAGIEPFDQTVPEDLPFHRVAAEFRATAQLMAALLGHELEIIEETTTDGILSSACTHLLQIDNVKRVIFTQGILADGTVQWAETETHESLDAEEWENKKKQHKFAAAACGQVLGVSVQIVEKDGASNAHRR